MAEALNIQEKETVGALLQQVKDHDNSREKIKTQAFVNVMFLYGNHHFKISRRRGFDNIDDIIAYEVDRYFAKQKIKRTSNYILPLYRALLSRLLRMKANITCLPTTSTASDRDVARVSEQVLDDFWQNCNRNNHWYANEYSGMQSVITKLCNFMLALGIGYLEPYYNPKTKSMLYDRASGEIFEADVGEAEIRVHHMLNVYQDRYNRWSIVRRRISQEQVWDEFGIEVPPDLSEYDNTLDAEIERALYGDVYGDRAKQDGVWIYTKYWMPCKLYPKGQKFTCTDNKILEDLGELPTEYKMKNPVIEFRYQDLGFLGRGQGCIEQVIDLQQDYDFTITRISQVKKLMTGKLIAPKGSKIDKQWDSEVGQIISYEQGMAPQYVEPAQVPQYYYQELERIRKDMEDLMNSHDSSMGRPQTGDQSGVAIQGLSEIDNSMIAPELTTLEQKLGHASEMILNIAEWKYSERRLLTVSGDDLTAEVNSFIGSDLVGQKRVIVRMGSTLPDDLASRQIYINNLVKGGYLTMQRGKELMEMGDLDGIYRDLDEAGAKTDIMNIVEGNAQVQAEPWEDPTIRLKVINDYRKGNKYTLLPPQKKAMIDALATQYQQMVQQAMQAQMQMQAQQAAAIAGAQEAPKTQGKVQVESIKAQPKRPVLENINFKDLPPDGKLQLAAQAGINLNPKTLIMDHVLDKKPNAPVAPGQNQGASQ